MQIGFFYDYAFFYEHRQASNIRRTKSLRLKDSRTVLRLSFAESFEAIC